MNDNELLDLYTDYLLDSTGLTTATGLSALLDRQVSHDRVLRSDCLRCINSVDDQAAGSLINFLIGS
jgi:hypothetical protein